MRWDEMGRGVWLILMKVRDVTSFQLKKDKVGILPLM